MSTRNSYTQIYLQVIFEESFVFPIISFVILVLAVMIYFKEIRSADEIMKKRRGAIENELPHFAQTLEQELKEAGMFFVFLKPIRKMQVLSLGVNLIQLLLT